MYNNYNKNKKLNNQQQNQDYNNLNIYKYEYNASQQQKNNKVDIVSQLASYMRQKNSQNNFIKKYNWKDIFSSSSQNSNKKYNQLTQEKQFKNFEYLTPNKNIFYKPTFQSYCQKTITIKNKDSDSSKTLKISSYQNKSNQNKQLYEFYDYKNVQKKQSGNKSNDQSSLSELFEFYKQINNSKKQKRQNQQPQPKQFNLKSFLQNQQTWNYQNHEKQQKINVTNQQNRYQYFNIAFRKRKNQINDEADDQYSTSNTNSKFQIKKIKMKFDVVDGNKLDMDKNQSDCKFKPKITQRMSSYHKPKRLKKCIEEEQNCSICLQQIKQRAKLPCKHQFCKQCLVDWLQKTSKCPLCRQNAIHYTFQGQKYQIQQKQYNLQNYVDNIGDQESEYDGQQSFVDLTYVCQNCDFTEQHDELLVCDRCFVNASHIYCDDALNGRQPPEHRQWYCSVCRLTPTLWYLQKRY